MGKTYKRSDPDFEYKLRKEEKKREKHSAKRKFLTDERKVYRQDDEVSETDRRR